MNASRLVRLLPRLLWLLALVLLLLPLFCVKTLITQDGQVHLYNAFVLYEWANKVDFYSQFYSINTTPSPNWLSEGLLVALMHMFSPDIAEKILQGCCVIFLPFGLYYAITALRPQQGLWALAALPLAYNFVFFYGFYNFCLSMPLCLYTIGSIWRKKQDLNLAQYFGLSLLFIINYFTHPVAWLVVGSVWFAYILQAFLATKNWRVFIKNSSLILPTLLLFLLFAERNGLGFFANKTQMPLIQWLVLWQAGAAFENKEKYVFALFGISLTLLLFWFLFQKIIGFYKKNIEKAAKNSKFIDFLQIFTQKYTFIAIPVAFLGYLYLLVPDFTAGGGYLTVRVSYFLIFFMIIALSCLDKTIFIKQIIAIFAIATTVFVYANRLPNMQNTSNFNDDLMKKAEKIPEQAVVLTLNYAMRGEFLPNLQPRMYLFKHIAARVGTKKTMILLENYEASTNYFPLLWKKTCNPYTNMGEKNSIDNEQPTADIAQYERISGKKVSHILILGQPAQPANASLKEVFKAYKTVFQQNNLSLLQKN